jgi:hypothetical protein
MWPRVVVATVFVLGLFTAPLWAEESRGTIAKVDPKMMTLTVVVGKAPVVYSVSRETSFYDEANRKIPFGIHSSRLRDGTPVRVTSSGRSLATRVQLMR